ncbi:MAG: LysM peptidoglycan-binding domain-containing protein [Chloroflexi bacterium]|nr:LysM peptidoglycan-binding domain-containing protein [Chloroflexota bacterium]
MVQSGETLWDIATSAGVDPNTLAHANDITLDDVLLVGQSITVPDGSSQASPPAPSATPSPRPAAATTPVAPGGRYTVAAGDTVWSIAQSLGTSYDALVQTNNLSDPGNVHVGDTLVVPGSGSGGGGSGAATRSAPATATGTPTSSPAKPGSGARTHTIQIGETLRDIAAQEHVNLTALIDINSIDNPALVHVGQVLTMPDGGGMQVAASVPARSPTPAATTGPNLAASSAAQPTTASSTATGPNLAASGGSSSATPTPKPAASPSPTASPSPAPSTPAGGLASLASKFLGTAYVWGGDSPGGFDCSGLVWYVAHLSGRAIPRTMIGEYNSSSTHPGRGELQPGDLVFFQNTYGSGMSHDGIYLDGGKFISAADEGSGVIVSDLNSAYWSAHWYGATRLK